MSRTGTVHDAIFLERPNRFLAKMTVHGDLVEVFVPNPGRMHEMMIPGRHMFVRHSPGPHRRTDYTLVGIEHDGVLVSLDSNLPNRFMKQALIDHSLPFFGQYESVQVEPPLYDGRFDFKLKEADDSVTLVEVKSCTLVEKGVALFPDAPTERGARHVRNLVRALEEGNANSAFVVFVIQRPDAKTFTSHDKTDPDFGEALRWANKNGVEVIPLLTRVVNWNLELISRIPYRP